MDDTAYEAHKDSMRQRQAEIVRRGSDLGTIPKIKNHKRRAKAEQSLRAFCETYAAERFPLKWAKHHLQELECCEEAIRHGGLQAIADPRGDGKTTRLEMACLWAVLTGHHRYVALLTAVQKQASKRTTSLKMLLLTSEPLYEDWPEVCVAIRKLGGIPARAAGMHCRGASVWPAADEVWGKRRIVLPTIAGSQCSGAVLEASGLLEAVRGLNAPTADGKIIRPTLVLADDPQTDRSAKSALMTEPREEALAKGILHLAGPDSPRVSALAAVTVIQRDDLADRMLDKSLHPEWHGIKNRMLESFPERIDLWDEWADLYRDELASGRRTFPKSTKFYRKNRKAMDAGAKVSWPERKEGATSAVENAMRKLTKDRRSFFSEMQNDPDEDQQDAQAEVLSAEAIVRKISGYERHAMPPAVQRLTWFIDVQKELLYYAICAWESGFTGYVIDYGTWPEQRAKYFSLRDCRQPISKDARVTAQSDEGRIAQALDLCLAELAARDYLTMDGTQLSLELGMIDANWGEQTDTVYQVCRQAQRRHGLRVLPCHGVPFGPAKKPLSAYDRRSNSGDVCGDEWRIPPAARGRGIRHVIADAGRRKSFLHRRLSTPIGDPGCLTLFHAPPERHRLLAEHLTAETGVIVSGPHGSLTAWTLLPGRDNHWLDCLAGCCTAESILGGQLATSIAPPSTPPPPSTPRRKNVRYL